MKHFSIVVRGRVQGVFFRASAREIALQLSLNGMVRNEPDGSVYIEAEGDEEALNRFVSWCRKGPPRAIIAEVIVKEDQVKNFRSFDIERY
jgi:acylphosphatase